MRFPELFSEAGFLNRDRRSKFLLVSILLFFVLAPLLEEREIGRLILILNLYVTLVSATMELAERRLLFFSAIPIAFGSMVLLLVSHYRPTRSLLIVNGVVLAVFLLIVSISLFIFLGYGRGSTNARLTISVSLYFLLGMSWFAIYNVVNSVQPGSIAEAGTPITGVAHWSTFLYFSMVTLTTLGYGDIIAIRPAARMFAVLEAAAGVLYLAITVARLVGAARSHEKE
jgi:Ion channel